MTAKRKSQSGSSSGPQTNKVFAYNDNVTSSLKSILPEEVGYITAPSLNLPPNTPDPDFFKQIDADVISQGSDAIVFTADTGEQMRKTISFYKGRISVITVKVPGAINQEKAFAALFKTSGFKKFDDFKKYEKIHLTMNGSNLRIEYTLKKKTRTVEKVKIVKNVFK